MVVLALLAGGGFWLWGGSGGASAPAVATTRLVAATAGTVRESVSTTGTIEPADQSSLSFAAAGRVTAVKVAQGDKVTKGQVLATIDSASLAASLAQARASLAAAEAKVASDEDSTTTTTTQLSADKAAETAAQGQVTSATMGLAGASMIAPIAGIVASVALTVGQQVSGPSGGSNTGSGTGTGTGTGTGSGGGTVGGSGSGGGAGSGSGSQSISGSTSSTAQVEIVGTTSWIVNATVDSTELALVTRGLQAQITTTGATAPVFGTVSSVGVLPSSTSTTTAYPVVIKVTGNPAGLHSGASATVAVIYKQVANVITVPTLAVHTSGGKSVVYTMARSKKVARTVTIGLSSGATVQIVSGLTQGQQVVVAVPAQLGNRSSTSNRTGTGRTGLFPGGGNFGGGGGGNLGGAGTGQGGR